MPPDNPICFSNHMGAWAIDAEFIRAAVASVRTGVMPQRDPSKCVMAIDFNASSGEVMSTDAGGRYTRHADGMATIRIDGPMMKGFSKFGGTSTVATRVALREAIDDPKVSAIMIVTDSPGGTVAGTQTLADEITASAKKKPLGVFVDDLSASASVWVTAGATEITARRSAKIGSVGVIAMLEDTSEAAERAGVKVYEFSTGEFKGVGHAGVEVTDEHQAYMQSMVDDMGKMFFESVAAGRGLDDEAMSEITTAKIFSAERALELGLIDAVGSFEDAVASLMKRVKVSRFGRRAKAAAAKARMIVDK